ncbi:MAG: hypothetical protein IJS09_04940 [Treponema sp.]|nr:hypothetical protein [Treponema sp.]
MTITITDNFTRHGSETVTFRYGLLVKNSRAHACVWEYMNSRGEKTTNFRSKLFRQASEYLAVLMATQNAEAYMNEHGGDAGLVRRAWERYLDTKQQKLFQEE